ncbi:MAG: O-antigen ligase family protein [Catonella sp.]|uniref:O-antigen ligase family protein n=1 Tax=Catonella sp. TaxID=2382125 RepID=UPI003F9FB7C5
MDYRYGYKEKKDDVSIGTKISLFLLGMVIAIIPLIVRAAEYNANLSQFAWFGGDDESMDVFLKVKGQLLVAVAVAMILMLAYKAFLEAKIAKLPVWIYLVFGYAGLNIISTIASRYKNFGFNGMFEQHETLWVILAYCVVLVYAFIFAQDSYGIGFIRISLGFLATVHSYIGISQLIGKDFWGSKLGRFLIIPSSFDGAESIRENLSFTFSGSGNHQVYLTLYNPNYVGSYAALVFPIFLVLAVFSNKMWKKIFWAIITIINFLCAMGSGSKTFLGAFVVSAIFAIILFRKKLKKGWPIMIGFIVTIIVSSVLYFNYIGLDFVSYVSNAIAVQKNDTLLEKVELEKDYAQINYNGVKFRFSYEADEEKAALYFFREDGKKMEYETNAEGSLVTLKDDKLKDLSFEYLLAGGNTGGYIINCNTPKGSFAVMNTENGYKLYTGPDKVDDIYDAPAAIIKDHDAFASGRGYIWSRTFPVFFNHLLLGTGADTFTVAFPQNDYIGRLNGGFGNMIITKPHNLFLQIGVQSGGLSLICFLGVAIIYIVQTFKLFWKRGLNSEIETFGAAISLGIIGYLVAGIFNDSCVALAPLYWVFLGVGYGINVYVAKLEK